MSFKRVAFSLPSRNTLTTALYFTGRFSFCSFISSLISLLPNPLHGLCFVIAYLSAFLITPASDCLSLICCISFAFFSPCRLLFSLTLLGFFLRHLLKYSFCLSLFFSFQFLIYCLRACFACSDNI